MRTRLAQLLKNFSRFIFTACHSVNVTEPTQSNGIVRDCGDLLILRNCFRNFALKFQSHRVTQSGKIKVAVQLDRLVELRDRFFETAVMYVGETEIVVNDEGERIELESPFHLRKLALVLAGVRERIKGEPVMGRGIVGIQLENALVFRTRTHNIELAKKLDRGE